jgi:hypothetical protein
VPSALIQSLNPLIGDFINTIDPKRTLRGQNSAVQRSLGVFSVLSSVAARQHLTSIQNDSDLAQGLAGERLGGKHGTAGREPHRVLPA